MKIPPPKINSIFISNCSSNSWTINKSKKEFGTSSQGYQFPIKSAPSSFKVKINLKSSKIPVFTENFTCSKQPYLLKRNGGTFIQKNWPASSSLDFKKLRLQLKFNDNIWWFLSNFCKKYFNLTRSQILNFSVILFWQFLKSQREFSFKSTISKIWMLFSSKNLSSHFSWLASFSTSTLKIEDWNKRKLTHWVWCWKIKTFKICLSFASLNIDMNWSESNSRSGW